MKVSREVAIIIAALIGLVGVIISSVLPTLLESNSQVPSPQSVAPTTSTEIPALPSPSLTVGAPVDTTTIINTIIAAASIDYPENGETVALCEYVRGDINNLISGQRAFLVVQSVQYGRIYPQGEVLPDAAGKWLLESIYETVDAQYETYVVATSSTESAEMLERENFRTFGMSVLPQDTTEISMRIISERKGLQTC